MAANSFKTVAAILFTVLGMLTTLPAANATTAEKKSLITPTSSSGWQQLSAEQRRELLNSYQNLRQLDDKDKQDLQQRMDWFSQLPKDQQQRMREVWQNMSATERTHWKDQLKNASAEQRDQLREQILEKYD